MATFSFAQEVVWADRVGSTGNNYTFNVVHDSYTGHTYATGRVKESCTFGELTNPTTPPTIGDRDVYLTKHDLNGNLVWVKRFGGVSTDYGQSIEIDADYIYLSGYFTDQCIIESDTLNSAGSQDIFVAKFAKDGALIWTRSWGGLGADIVSETYLDGSDFYLVGEFEDSINFDGIDLINTIPLSYTNREASYLVKLDTTGNVIWAEKQESTRGVRPQEVKVLDGYVYVAGNCYGDTYFDGNLYTSTNPVWQDQFICKYDDAANFYWTNLFGNNWNEAFHQLELGDNNTTYACGFFKGLVTYGPDTYNITEQNGIIVKMDTSGTVTHSYHVNSTGIGEVDGLTYTNGRLFAGGYFYDTLFIINDTVISTGQNDNFLIEFDQSMVPIDYFVWGGTSYDQVRHMSSDPTERIFVGGSFRGTCDFQTASFSAAANTYDGYILEYCPGIHDSLSVSTFTACTNETIVLYNHTIGADPVITNLPSEAVIEYSNTDSIGVSFNTSGNYSLQINFDNHCASDSIVLNGFSISDMPTLDLGPDITDCDTHSIYLVANGVYDMIVWNTSEVTDSILAPTSGTYWANVTTIEGCSYTDSIDVTILLCASMDENELGIEAFYGNSVIYLTRVEELLGKPLNINLFDSQGRILLNKIVESDQIPIPNLPLGVYILQLSFEGKIATFKIPLN